MRKVGPFAEYVMAFSPKRYALKYIHALARLEMCSSVSRIISLYCSLRFHLFVWFYRGSRTVLLRRSITRKVYGRRTVGAGNGGAWAAGKRHQQGSAARFDFGDGAFS